MRRPKSASEAAARFSLAMAFLFILSGLLITRSSEKPEGADNKAVLRCTLSDIKVSFKRGSRHTRGLYIGDRWVSPPVYSRVGEGKELAVETRAHGVDAEGKPMNIRPDWIPADPGMVTVTPAQGNEVKITVQRAGESSLEVTSGRFSRKLSIKAARQGDAMRVEISQ